MTEKRLVGLLVVLENNTTMEQEMASGAGWNGARLSQKTTAAPVSRNGGSSGLPVPRKPGWADRQLEVTDTLPLANAVRQL
jgi:hypothetical protein